MRSFRIFCLLLALPIFAFAAKSAHAQADPNFEIGLKPYGSYQMGNIDTVSLGNGSLAVDIPLLSYPQRGGKLKLDIDLEYLNGSTYYETPCFPVVGCVLVPYPTPGYFSLIDKGLVSPGSVCSDNESCLAVSESDGAEHAMGAVSGQTNLLETIDGSAYRIETGVPNQVYTSIIDSAGTTYYPSWPVTGCSNPPCTLREDANGNQISYLLLTGWVDTMGRKIPNLTGTGTTNPSDFGGCTGTGTIVSVDIWNPPGVNGGTYPLKLCYVSVTLLGGTTTFTELQSIVLPNGSAWTLTYQELAFGSPYGSYEVPTLSQITFPTGGTISYTWTGTLPCSISTAGEYGNANFAVATRALNPNDGVDPVGTSQYSYSGTPGTATVGSGVLTTIVTDPSGSDTVHTFGLGGCYLYETQTQSYQGLHTTGALLKTVNTTYSYTQANPLYYGQIATLLNLVPTKVVTTLSNGQQSQITHTYDSGFEFQGYTITTLASGNTSGKGGVIQGTYGKELTRSEYDYANPAPGTLLRTTTSAYLALSNSTYLTANLIDLPSSVQIKDGGGTQRAYTTYAYDETGSPAGAHGNLTSIHRWLNTTGGYLVTSNVYNSNGLVTSSTDPKTNPTSFGYTGSYAGSGPTTITNALNQSVTNVYDSNTGLLTSTTDPNSKTTSYQYDDMLRTTQVSYPDGGLTTFTYFPVFQGGAYVYIAEKMDASGDDRDTTAWVDGVGREGRVAISNGETLNYDEPTDICYDGLGRVAFSAYPFQDDGWSAPRSCTIAGDSFTYDGLSRTIKVTHSDGSFISTSYSGNSTTVTDEQGKTRESYSDGLGRLSQVIENPGGLNYTTAYTYDALNNLTGVTQASSRQRTFVYDSLSRLISSTNPEANWAPSTQTSVATTYAYDADGNLVNKTEPAPNQQSTSTVTLTYCYDALNRMTAKGYTSQTCANGLLPTPVATYVYDAGALPAGCSVGSFSYGLAIGKRTAMCDAAGSEAWSYTIVSGTGWQTTDQRTTNGLTKNAVYQNNFLGLPASVQYPSGRTITYGYNVGARPISATDGTTSVSYAKTVHYLANGARCWAVLGGAATGAETFNGRLQPLEMQATSAVVAYPGTGCPGLGQTGNLQDVSYNFDLGSGDNGNVMGITNNRDTTRSQAFSYDALNRIVTATASTYAGSPAHCWGEAYQFDNQTTGGAWGNLTSIGVASTSYNGCTQESLSVTATAQNRVSTSGYYYDTAGNLTTISGATYSFDAENHLTSTAGVNYTYDGDGKRVEKSNGKIYWYGMDGYVLDETDLTGSTTNSSFNEYVFFGENRIARRDSSNNVYYYASDHLGTSRVIAEVPSGSTTATLCYDADFYPFGGERPYTNSCTQNYKFTAKERDSESGLDNFAARYDSSSMARFMSPDEIGPGQHPGAPQTWNLYSYVNNNPLTLTDPSGRYTCDKNTMTQAQCDAFQAGLIQAQADADKLKDKYGANSKQYKDAQNAINSFGREGVDNGVHIAFGDTGKYAATTTYGPFAGSTQNNPDGQNITVTLNSDHPSLAGDALTEAHEGSHVYDLSGWIMSVGAPSMDITSRETENRAYNVTANLASVDSRFNAWYTINFDNPTRGYLIFSNDPSWNQDMQDRFVGILINSEYSDPNKRLDSFYRNTNPGR